jgi:hypothetical protein
MNLQLDADALQEGKNLKTTPVVIQGVPTGKPTQGEGPFVEINLGM